MIQLLEAARQPSAHQCWMSWVWLFCWCSRYAKAFSCLALCLLPYNFFYLAILSFLPVTSLSDPADQLSIFVAGDERPALVAWFCVARLYYKMIKSDSQEAIDCMHKTLMYYKQVVEACDKHSHYRELMTAELPVCREMVKLLPVKISKMIAHAEGS